MIALIDCNNFFVSCERIGHPELEDLPVIVLSGTGGCVVAMSNEAKALGIRRSDPYFRIRHICERHNVVALPGQRYLYSEVSARVMGVLREMSSTDIEVYSIDEAFFYPDPRLGDMAEYGRYVVSAVKEHTGIPVSLGMAPTKTLAKLAARFAKKYPGYRGACVIDTPEKALKAMEMTPVGSVWGIGRKLSRRLAERGIVTAAQFAALTLEQVERMFSLPTVRTWRELHGEPCIIHESTPPQRRTISNSTTLPHDTYDIESLTQSLSRFCSTVARKMRRSKLVCSEITVHIRTNPFHTDAPQHSDSATVRLPDYTDYTPHMVEAATEALRRIYRPGYGYKKIGVTAGRMELASHVEQSLFADTAADDKRHRLMTAVDAINASLPRGTGASVRLASSQTRKTGKGKDHT